jgi:hypothetical protein
MSEFGPIGQVKQPNWSKEVMKTIIVMVNKMSSNKKKRAYFFIAAHFFLFGNGMKLISSSYFNHSYMLFHSGIIILLFRGREG